jgi:Haem-binding domain
MLKKTLLVISLLLMILQLIKPDANTTRIETFGIDKAYNMPADIKKILAVACNDCHSNSTNYPWYANIQPVAWWLNHHIEDGKKHLNFSTFLKLPISVQHHKLEETIEVLEKKEMPLASYTYFGLHKEAKLTPDQTEALINWAKAQMDTLQANFPPDSLILKRHKE